MSKKKWNTCIKKAGWFFTYLKKIDIALYVKLGAWCDKDWHQELDSEL